MAARTSGISFDRRDAHRGRRTIACERAGGRPLSFQPGRRLAERRWPLRRALRAADVPERRHDVADERGTLEPAERANGGQRGIRIGAPEPAADDRHVARRGRPAVLGLQDREAAGRGVCAGAFVAQKSSASSGTAHRRAHASVSFQRLSTMNVRPRSKSTSLLTERSVSPPSTRASASSDPADTRSRRRRSRLTSSVTAARASA